MTNVDSFKSFVKKNPNLITHVRNGSMSWQKFYELYDLYGEEGSVWKDYLVKEEAKEVRTDTSTSISSGNTLSNILEMARNIDTNKLQDGITSIQKAISLFGDMITKDKPDVNNYTPRPIYRKFDD